MFLVDGLKRIYSYFVADSVKTHKISLIKASYNNLEQKILSNYPPEKVAVAILHTQYAQELVTGIAERRWSAEDVMRVYCLQSLRLHREYNFISEQFMEDAILLAITLDAKFRSTGRLVGPLHGLPIALKDDMDVKGYDTTLGCKCGCLQPKHLDAPIVECLRTAGAIPFCKTNVSWHLLSAECTNTLFGQTLNPLDTKTSPGGSSGGVSALVAAGGALVGIGSDAVGGLRVPAQHCGLYCLKPTSSRLPPGTTNNNTLSWDTIPRVFGPVSRSLPNIVTIFRSLLLTHPWRTDPSVVPISFDHALYTSILESRRLKIGWYTNDGFLRALPPACRAVHTAVTALEKQGHEVVEFHPPKTIQAVLLLTKLLVMDLDSPCTFLREFQQDDLGEPIVPLMLLMRAPMLVRALVATFFERIMDDTVVGQMIRTLGLGGTTARFRKGPKAAAELVQLQKEKEEYQRLFAEAWNEMDGMDVLICPVHAIPPLPSVSFPYTSAGTSYSMLYGLLDYPVGVVPNVTAVTAADRVQDTLMYVHSQEGAPPPVNIPGQPAVQSHGHHKGCFNFLGILGVEEFNSRLAEGVGTEASVAVQVVGRRFEEEKVLAVMELLRHGLEKKE
ncbi:glutaminyl-tRNA synthase (glutamine-hydrolysing) [Spizellomyces sp. 'palustris']|nr:glutaminyl-tRNA synthase (glutamine-hydrolysing) [Spizellomyces sp. 'palustris']